MAHSNEEWDSLIKQKIIEIKSLDNPPSVTSPASPPVPSNAIARTIDHTLLKPEATSTQIDQLCKEAIQHNLKSCCVNGTYIAQVAQQLAGSNTIPCCVVGFPLGASSSKAKAFEAQQAVFDGAKEIDMVMNIGALKSRNYTLVYDDIRAVIQASVGQPVKVILETALLSDEEKIAASFIAAEAGASFVKTSTGFHSSGGGATVADVVLMKRSVEYKGIVGVKASAGIRDLKTCLEMLVAGADRIGTSSGVGIVQNAGTDGNGY